MRVTKMSDYAPQISDIITTTNQTGEEMGKSFDPLSKAIKSSDFSSVDLSKTKDIFQSGTNKYFDILNKLNAMKAPARALGKHKQLVASYKDYADACQDMVNTIDVDNQNVDQDAFKQSEDAQEKGINEVVKYAQRIMML